jgi:hypothetical protein
MRGCAGTEIAVASTLSGAACALPPGAPGIAPSRPISKTKRERSFMGTSAIDQFPKFIPIFLKPIVKHRSFESLVNFLPL